MQIVSHEKSFIEISERTAKSAANAGLIQWCEKCQSNHLSNGNTFAQVYDHQDEINGWPTLKEFREP